MIPNFNSVEKIRKFRPGIFLDRTVRISAIETALKQLGIFHEAGKIERKDFVEIRSRLLIAKSEEGVRWQRENGSKRAMMPTTQSVRPG